MASFDYSIAFSRNIGWLTESEQQALRSKRVAIAGMGGVGGSHLVTLTRLGVEKFNIADPDTFELANFNRQAGATLSSLQRAKVDVLADMVRDINPSVDIRIFPSGVTEQNLVDFFADVDVYVDGLDFFAFEIRELVFEFCHRQGIPAITVAPLGVSAALLNFLPKGMSFEDYFQVTGKPVPEKAIRFLVGLAPALLHRNYLVNKSRVDLKANKGPSTIMACQLCSGVAASEAMKILLGRGRIWAAPHGIQFDGYRNKLAHTWRPGGNRHPLNRLAIAMAKRQLGI
jgi:molybdopterin/thiamine biosynthesis adenylyltransferase